MPTTPASPTVRLVPETHCAVDAPRTGPSTRSIEDMQARQRVTTPPPTAGRSRSVAGADVPGRGAGRSHGAPVSSRPVSSPSACRDCAQGTSSRSRVTTRHVVLGEVCARARRRVVAPGRRGPWAADPPAGLRHLDRVRRAGHHPPHPTRAAHGTSSGHSCARTPQAAATSSSARSWRAMMLLRARTLASGHTGVRPLVLDALLALLDHGITPAVQRVRLPRLFGRPRPAEPRGRSC